MCSPKQLTPPPSTHPSLTVPNDCSDACWQRRRLPQKIDGHHPNFILQLYSSMDFGRKWQLVHDNVMPGRFYWYDYAIFFLFLSIFSPPSSSPSDFSAAIDCNLHNEGRDNSQLLQTGSRHM